MKKFLLLTLTLILLAGLFVACGSPSNTTSGSEETTLENPNDTTDTKEPERTDFTNLPREAATEGIVLLKNEDNVLPFKQDTTVTMFGSGQVDLVKGGSGSGDVTVEKVVGILEGMDTKVAEGKVQLYEEIAEGYRKNSNYMPASTLMKRAADDSDVGVFVITRKSGEGSDRSAGKGDYYLSDTEVAMLKNMIRAGFDNIVVILNIGGIMDTTQLLSYPEVKSILLVWQPGMDGGNAIADVLVGDVSPSGKLSDTFCKSYDDYPSSAGFHESVDYVNYTEDIYVGYRYFETFDPEYTKVNFEFGFGLSYTTFDMSDVTVTEEGENLKVTAKVTNTGEYSGKEVVQVYFSAPQGELGKPAKELAGFAKTSTLAPGESETVTVTFAISDMSSYDDMGHVQKSAYVMEAGDYKIYVGNSVKNAGENGVRYTYKVDKLVVTEQLTEQLTAKLLEKRLKADGTYEYIYNDEGIGIPLGKDLLKVEAEAFYAKHCHAEVRFNSTATICGVKTLTSNEGLRYVTFAFEVETAGKYSVKLGISNSSSAKQNGVSFYVNGVLQAGNKLTIPGTGSEWVMKETEAGIVTLQEGLNFVKVQFDAGDSFTGILDYITIQYGESTAEVGGTASASVETAPVLSDIDDRMVALAAANQISFTDLCNDPTLMEAFIDQLTIEQMVYLLHGHGENVPHGTGTIGGIAELGIPSTETIDGPAGINMTINEKTTAWPIETMLACTWNTELLRVIGHAVAKEAEQYDVDVWLAPGLNIHRNPLCGRNFEYYSEDPLLSGLMAAAITTGMQEKGIGVTVKHFVGNEKETNRGYTDSRVSERALREIYLKPFEIAVKQAQPWLIMTSYNKVNGMETAENRELITNILRNEWGFEGLVTTDWWNDSVQYKEILAGNDIKMKSGDEAGVIGAYKSGILTREDIEVSVERVLKLIMKSNATKRITEDRAITISANEPTVIRCIQAAWKSSNIGMEVCEDVDGTYNTTNTYGGEWLIFVVDVEEAGDYTFTFRVASEEGTGTIRLSLDGKSIGNFRNTKKTGGWQSWTDGTPIKVTLTEGSHQLRFSFTQGGFNVNTVTIEPVAE